MSVGEGDQRALAVRFEEERRHLRAVAYRLTGSLSDAEDAVQESWLRLSRAEVEEIENLGAWLTTVVARVSLNMLRSRRSRPEESFGPHLPDPIVDPTDGTDPEHEALLGDSVGLALLVVLEGLTPPERLSLVLHDSFSVPFEEIGAILDRSPAAARQLASRARRRLTDVAPRPDPDPAAQREVVGAFLAAAHEGDLDRLVAVLDPEVVLRADGGGAEPGLSREVHGAEAVAGRARSFSRIGLVSHPVLVNGAAGILSIRDGRPFSLLGFTVAGGRIVEIDILADPGRLSRIDLDFLTD